MCLSCHGYSNSVRGIFYNHRNQPNFSHLTNNNKNSKKKKKTKGTKAKANSFEVHEAFANCTYNQDRILKMWGAVLRFRVDRSRLYRKFETLIRNPSRPVLDWAWTLRLHSFWVQREWVSFSLITAGLDWN